MLAVSPMRSIPILDRLSQAGMLWAALCRSIPTQWRGFYHG